MSGARYIVVIKDGTPSALQTLRGQSVVKIDPFRFSHYAGGEFVYATIDGAEFCLPDDWLNNRPHLWIDGRFTDFEVIYGG